MKMKAASNTTRPKPNVRTGRKAIASVMSAALMLSMSPSIAYSAPIQNGNTTQNTTVTVQNASIVNSGTVSDSASRSYTAPEISWRYFVNSNEVSASSIGENDIPEIMIYWSGTEKAAPYTEYRYPLPKDMLVDIDSKHFVPSGDIVTVSDDIASSIFSNTPISSRSHPASPTDATDTPSAPMLTTNVFANIKIGSWFIDDDEVVLKLFAESNTASGTVNLADVPVASTASPLPGKLSLYQLASRNNDTSSAVPNVFMTPVKLFSEDEPPMPSWSLYSLDGTPAEGKVLNSASVLDMHITFNSLEGMPQGTAVSYGPLPPEFTAAVERSGTIDAGVGFTGKAIGTWSVSPETKMLTVVINDTSEQLGEGASLDMFIAPVKDVIEGELDPDDPTCEFTTTWPDGTISTLHWDGEYPPTTTAICDIFWMDNANSESTRPSTEQIAEILSIEVYDDAGNYLSTIPLPEDTTWSAQGVGNWTLSTQLPSVSVSGETLHYKFVQNSKALLDDLSYYDDKDAGSWSKNVSYTKIYDIQTMDFVTHIQDYDGDNLIDNKHPDFAGSLVTGNNSPIAMTRDGAVYEYTGSKDWSFDPNTGIGTLTYHKIPMYSSDNHLYDYRTVMPNGAPGVQEDTVYGDTALHLHVGDDKYLIRYDNTNVPNYGADNTDCANGGYITLTLHDQTMYDATKYWLDDSDTAARPNVQFELWRYIDKEGASFKTAAPVRDKEGNYVKFSLEGSQAINNTQKLTVAPNSTVYDLPYGLEEYEPNGYKYVYILREIMGNSPTGATYKQQYGGATLDAEGNVTGLTDDWVPYGNRDSLDQYVYNEQSTRNLRSDVQNVESTKTWVANAYTGHFEEMGVEMTLYTSRTNSEDPADWTPIEGMDPEFFDDFTFETPSHTFSATVNSYDELGYPHYYRWRETKVTESGSAIYTPESGSIYFQTSENKSHSYADDPHYDQFTNWEGTHDLKRTNTERFTVDELTVKPDVNNVLSGIEDYVVQKKWVDEDGNDISEQKVGTPVAFTLIGSDGSRRTITIDGTPDGQEGDDTWEAFSWIGQFNNIPKYSANGGRIDYYVIENNSYTAGISMDAVNRVASVVNGPGKGVVIAMSKKWLDDGDAACRCEPIVEVWYQPEDGSDPVKVSQEEIRLTETEGWYRQYGIPSSFLDDDPGKWKHENYFMKEVALYDPRTGNRYEVENTNQYGDETFLDGTYTTPDHQYVVSHGYEVGELGDMHYVVNRRVGWVDITATKIWQDKGAIKNNRPDAYFELSVPDGQMVEFQPSSDIDIADGSVYATDVKKIDNIKTKIAVDKTADYGEAGKTTYTFSSLPKYDKNGVLIAYNVEEKFVDPADAASKDYHLSTDFEYTERQIVPSTEVRPSTPEHDLYYAESTNSRSGILDAVFYKEWDDAYAYQNGWRPDVYVNLYSTTSLPEDIMRNIQLMSENDVAKVDDVTSMGYRTNLWSQDPRPGHDTDPRYMKVTFPNLPKYDSNGDRINYFASESTTLDYSQFDYQPTLYKDSQDNWVTYDDPESPWVQKATDGATTIWNGGMFVNTIKDDVKIEAMKRWQVIPDGFIGDLPEIKVELLRYVDGETIEDAQIIYDEGGNQVMLEHVPTPLKTTQSKFSFYHEEGKPTTATHYDYAADQYDELGRLYHYVFRETISNGDTRTEEVEVPELYDFHFYGDDFIIDNTYNEKYDADVWLSKGWTGREVLSGDITTIYPKGEFELHRVYKNNLSEQTDIVVDTKTISAKQWQNQPNLSVKFEDLLVYAPDGFKYIYYISEKETDGYVYSENLRSDTGLIPYTEDPALAALYAFTLEKPDGSPHGDEDDGTVINDYQPGSVSLTGEKLWNDNKGTYGTRPYASFNAETGTYSQPNFAALGLKLYRRANAQPGQDNSIAKEEVPIPIDEWNWEEITVGTAPDTDTAWKYTINDLPQWAPNGTQWIYSVEENLAAPYSQSYAPDQPEYQSTWNEENDRYEVDDITNNLDLRELTYTKIWESETYAQHPAVKAELQYRFVGETAWKRAMDNEIFVRAAEASYPEDPTWTIYQENTSVESQHSVTVSNLPKKIRDNGTFKEVELRYVEIMIERNGTFEPLYDGDNDLLLADDFSNLNDLIRADMKTAGRYRPVAETGTSTKNELVEGYVKLTVDKNWIDDENDAYGTRPSTLTFVIYRKEATADEWELAKDNNGNNLSIVLRPAAQKSSPWTTTVSNLPKYSPNGILYEYTAKEWAIPNGYTCETGSDIPDSEYTEATKTWDTETSNRMKTTDVGGKKAWNAPNKSYTLEETKSMVKLTLQRKSGTSGWSTVTYAQNSGQPYWFEEDGEYRFHYPGLPLQDKNGKAYSYQVVEQATTAIGGFSVQYTDSRTLTDVTTAGYGSTVKNTPTALVLDKINAYTKGKLAEDDLALEVRDSTGATIAVWTRPAGQAEGTFTVKTGLAEKYVNVYAGNDGATGHESLANYLYCLPVATYTIVETVTPEDYKTAASTTVAITASTTATAPATKTISDTPKGSNLKLAKYDKSTQTALKGAKFEITKTGETSFKVTMTDNGDGTYSALDLAPGTYTITEKTPPLGYNDKTSDKLTATFTLTEADKNKTFDVAEDTETSAGAFTLTNGSWVSDGVGNVPHKMIVDKFVGDEQLSHDKLEITVKKGTTDIFTWKRNADGETTTTLKVAKTGDYANAYVGDDGYVYGLPTGDYTVKETGDMPEYAWAKETVVTLKADGALAIKTAGDGSIDSATNTVKVDNHLARGQVVLTKTVKGGADKDKQISFSLYKQSGASPDPEEDTLIATGETDENGEWKSADDEETEDGLYVGKYYFVETEASPDTKISDEYWSFEITKDHDLVNGTIDHATAGLVNEPYKATVTWMKTDVSDTTSIANLLDAEFTLEDSEGNEIEISFDATKGYSATLPKKDVYTLTEKTPATGYKTTDDMFSVQFEIAEDDYDDTINLVEGAETSVGEIELLSGSWNADGDAAGNIPLKMGVDKVVDSQQLSHDKLELTVSKGNTKVFTFKRNSAGVVTVSLVATTGDFKNAYVGDDNYVYGLPTGDYTVSETGNMPEYAWAKNAVVTLNANGTLTLKTAGDATIDANTCTVKMDNHLAKGDVLLTKEVVGGAEADKRVSFDLYKQLGNQPDPKTDTKIASGKTDADGKWNSADDEETEDGLYVGKYYFVETEASPDTKLASGYWKFEITKDHDRVNGTIEHADATLQNETYGTTVKWMKTDVDDNTSIANSLDDATFVLTDPDGETIEPTYNPQVGYSAVLTKKGTYTLTETEAPTGYTQSNDLFEAKFIIGDEEVDDTIVLTSTLVTSGGAIEVLSGSWNKDGNGIGNVPHKMGVDKFVDGTQLSHNNLELTVLKGSTKIFTFKRNAAGVTETKLIVAATGDYRNAYVGSDGYVYGLPSGDYTVRETGDMTEYAWAKDAVVTLNDDGTLTLKTAGDATLDSTTNTVKMDNHLARGHVILTKEITGGGEGLDKHVSFDLYKQVGENPDLTKDTKIASGETDADGKWSSADDEETKDGLYVGKYYFVETEASADTALASGYWKFTITKDHDLVNGTIENATATLNNEPYETSINWMKTDIYKNAAIANLLGVDFKLYDPNGEEVEVNYDATNGYSADLTLKGEYTLKETNSTVGYVQKDNLFEATFSISDADHKKTKSINSATATVKEGAWNIDEKAVGNTPIRLAVDKLVSGAQLSHNDLELTVSRNGAAIYTFKRNAAGVVSTALLTPTTGEYEHTYIGSDNALYGIPTGDYTISETGDMPEYAWANDAVITIAADGTSSVKTAGDATLDTTTNTVKMDNHLARGHVILTKEIDGGATASKEITFALYKQNGSTPDPKTDTRVATGKTDANGIWKSTDDDETKDGLYVGDYYFLETEANPETVISDKAWTFRITKDHDIVNGTIKNAEATMTNKLFHANVNWMKTDSGFETSVANLLKAGFRLVAPDGKDVTVSYDAQKGYAANLVLKGTYTLIETTAPDGYAQRDDLFSASFVLGDDEYEKNLTIDKNLVTSKGAISVAKGTWNIDGGAIGNTPRRLGVDKVVDGKLLSHDALELTVSKDNTTVFTFTRGADGVAHVNLIATTGEFSGVYVDSSNNVCGLPVGDYKISETGDMPEYAWAKDAVARIGEDGSVSLVETGDATLDSGSVVVKMDNHLARGHVILTKVIKDGKPARKDISFDLYLQKGAEPDPAQDTKVASGKTDSNGIWKSIDDDETKDGLYVGKYYFLETEANPELLVNYEYWKFEITKYHDTINGTIDHADAVMEDETIITSINWMKTDIKETTSVDNLKKAEFTLTDPDGQLVEIFYDEKSGYSAKIEKKGEYTLTEILAPTHYKPEDLFSAKFSFGDGDHGKTFTVNAAMTTSVGSINKTSGLWNADEGAIGNIRIAGNLSFDKFVLDKESCSAEPGSKHALEGAEFTIYTDEMCTITAKNYDDEELIATSDSNGKVSFSKILPGTYYMKETSTPEEIDPTAIESSQPYIITAVENGIECDITMKVNKGAEDITEIVNDVYRGDLTLTKVSEIDGKTPVSGSEYGIFNKDEEEPITTSTTDKDGKISFNGLIENKEYDIRELTAPTGSLLSSDTLTVSFKYDRDNGKAIWSGKSSSGAAKIDENGNIIWDEPQTRIRIDKVDENGKPLAGAAFHIADENGAIVGESWISSTEGHMLDSILEAGKQYTLIEDNAPNGYQKAENIVFTVDDTPRQYDENYIQVVSMQNVPVVVPPDPNPITPDTGNDPNKTNGSSIGNTGDTMYLAMLGFFAVILTAGGVLVASRMQRRRDK